MSIRYLSIIFLFSYYAGYAQLKNDSEIFESYLNKAQSEPDRATHYYFEARKLHLEPSQEIKLNRLISRSFFDQGQYDSAKIFLRKSFELDLESSDSTFVHELAKSHIIQGAIQMQSSEYEASKQEFLRAMDLLRGKGILSEDLQASYFYMGRIYKRTGQLDRAKIWVKRSLDFATENNYTLLALKGYGEMGLIHMAQYQYALAREYFQLGLTILNSHEIENADLFRITRHHNIGLTFDAENNMDSAIFHSNRVIALLEKAPLNDLQRAQYRGTSLHNIANLYWQQEALDSAILYCEKSIAVFEKQFGKNQWDIAYPLRSLGELSAELLDFENANKHLKRSLDITKFNKDVIGTMHSYNVLGYTALDNDDLTHAKLYCDSAIAENTYLLNGEHEFYDYSQLFFSLRLQTKIMLVKSDLQRHEVDSLYSRIKSLVNRIHQEDQSPRTMEAMPIVMEYLYQAYKNIHERSSDPHCLTQMWELLELNKAIKLRNQLKTAYSLTYTIPEDLRMQEKAIKDSINLILSNVEINTFDSTLFFLKRRHDALISKIEAEHPRYANLKRKPLEFSYQQKQSQLTRNEAHLTFLEGQDSIYLLILKPKQLSLASVQKDTAQSIIEQFNEALMSHNIDLISRLSDQIVSIFHLGHLLSEDIEHITIVPDGIIWKLNFAALSYRIEDSYTYLGNELTLSYHYYSNPAKPEIPNHVQKEVLAFSFNEVDDDPVDSNYVAFRNINESLPGTSKEVVAISKQWKGDYYFANAANESMFKEQSRHYSILHLAVHGYMDENYPENSFLKFAASDSLNDGKLHAYELYNLDINAELAVLTACNSGEGKIQSGEGMMSIGRAFAYAGVESLLASRWEVPDISTPFLMTYFYQGLKQGMRKSQALQYAQQQFLENHADNITSVPFYWAGFYVIGDDRPLENLKSPRNYWYGGLLMLAAFSAIVLRRKKRTWT